LDYLNRIGRHCKTQPFFLKKHRHLFEKLNLGKRIFSALKAQLKAKGALVQSRHGEVVWLFWTASIVNL